MDKAVKPKCFSPRAAVPWGIGILLAATSWLAVWSPLQLAAHGQLHLQIEELTRQIQRDTNNAALYYRRAELHRQHQDAVAAAADYDRVAKLNPSFAAVDLGRGRLLLDLGQFSQAKVVLNRYLAAEPDDSDGLVVRARVLAKLGEAQAAANDFSRAITLSPDPQPDHYLERAQVLVTDGDAPAALAGLEEGMARLGPLLTFQQAALEIELSSQQHEAALTRLNAIISTVSRKEQWLARKGDTLLKLDRRKEAAEAYRAATLAIEALPPRLRQSPAVAQLKTRVDQALKSLSAEGTSGK